MSEQAGYSGTPLVKKLGYRPGWTVLLTSAPDGFADRLGADGILFDEDVAPETAQAAHVFLRAPGDLANVAGWLQDLPDGAMLWLSWAMKSSPLHAGVTEDDLRAAILPAGWVDVKVCAVDADWSGLKFLRRKS